MKKKILLPILCSLLLITTVSGAIHAQRAEAIAYAGRWYVKKERLFDDWVVEFSLPKDAEVRLVYCAGGPKEDGLFDKSGVEINRQTKKVTVVAGGYARHQSGYKGSLESWARTLRVRYAAPFRPRG